MHSPLSISHRNAPRLPDRDEARLMWQPTGSMAPPAGKSATGANSSISLISFGIAFWSDRYGVRGTFVVWRPGVDGGTAFSPDDGRDYFDDGDWKTNE